MDATRYNQILNYIRSNVYPDDFTKIMKHGLWRISKKFTIDGEKLFFVGKGKKAQVIVGEELAIQMFKQFHSSLIGGHSGINKTKKSIGSRFYWPNMTVDIEQWIKECGCCQKEQPALQISSELKPIKVKEVWELLGANLIGPLPITPTGNKYILTATDYFSKWVEAFPLKTKTAEEVASRLLSMYLRHGSPKRVLSDQGREFVNQVNSELSRLLQIERSVSAAYHPQTNGLDERTNANIKSTLSKYVNKHQNDWDLYLDHALFALQSKPHTTTKVSPFKLMYGREARFPCEVAEDLLDFTLTTESDYVGILDEMQSKRAELQSQTKMNIEIAQEKQKEKYKKRVSKRYKPCTFTEGQLVLLKNSRRSTRKGGVLEPKFTGPYSITEINGKTVKLANASNVPLSRTFNIDMLRPYKSSTIINTSKEKFIIQESTASVPAESPSVDMPGVNDGGSYTLQKLQAVWDKPASGRLEAIVSNVKLYDSSLQSLKPTGWIVDEIIDAYFGKLCLARPNCIAFSATVSSAIFMGRYRSSVFQVPFGDKEIVLCPTNIGIHWILLVLKPTSRQILVYDSMVGNIQSYSNLLLNWRAFLQALKFPDYQLWKLTVQSSPKQLDSYNCDIFCKLFADSYLSQQPVTDISNNFNDMEMYRKKIALDLIESSDSVDEFCGVCSEKYSENNLENTMVLCIECFRWIHLTCIQTDEETLLQQKGFHCSQCISK